MNQIINIGSREFLKIHFMKKFNCFIATLVGAFTIGLIGCAPKLPTTNYEKVKLAFNGVEKSFKNKKASNKAMIVVHKSKIVSATVNLANLICSINS